MIEHINALPGIVLNIFLLYLIKRFSRKDLGTYKNLLAVFATYDILLILLHTAINVKAVITDELYGVMSSSFPESLASISLYGSSFMVPFSLLIIHFIYRYWVIRFPHRVELFTNLIFIIFLVICVSVITVIWFCLCQFGLDTNQLGYLEARLKLAAVENRTHIDGWFIFQPNGKLSLRTVINLLAFDGIMMVMSITSIILAVLTFLHIHDETTLSAQARHSQLRILFVVCIQTIVPFIFVYSPYLMLFNLPLLGFRTPLAAANITPFVHSIFPMLDALIIILLMRDYRNGARTLLFGIKDKQVAPSILQLSHNNHGASETPCKNTENSDCAINPRVSKV